ncbi:MAG: sodium/glutamate symporter [Pyrinomonadaceae bacterium]|nr:sodium/glutamate symporter [Pyrinomonadaceae bacterium]
MEWTIVDGLRSVKFDLVLTLGLAALALALGYALQQRIGLLARSSIPTPAIGGLLFACIVLMLRANNVFGIVLDTSLRGPLQTAFFTTIGLSATIMLLRAGGWRMGFFWMIASLLAVVQNVVGIAVARAVGAPAALGIICGALTLTGGPATGLAFSNIFEQQGVVGAATLIIASATFGIFTASLVGNPVATCLIRRFHLASLPEAEVKQVEDQHQPVVGEATEAEGVAARAVESDARQAGAGLTAGVLLNNLLIIMAVMGAGALVGLWLTRVGVTLPGYVGAMMIAALVRFLDDRFGWLRIDMRAVEALGAIALTLFLVLALMDLKLWQLTGLAAPMLAILLVQIVVTILYAGLVTFVLMGRDYEAAVMASGHIGFGLGITPNAVANMEALTKRYRAAPRSFLIVPVVGAFFIDFSNALVITLFINLLPHA